MKKLAVEDHYGILRPKTSNLGDDLQFVVAREFLTSFGIETLCELDRDAPAFAICHKSHKIFVNGWLSHEPLNFIDWNDFYSILPIGIHLTDFDQLPFFGNISERVLKKFKSLNVEIGARDLHTLFLLRNSGIPAYLSLCVSLTIERVIPLVKKNHYYLVDVPKKIELDLQTKFPSEVLSGTNEIDIQSNWFEREVAVNRVIENIINAKVVITSRMHIALPALALGVPVLLLKTSTNDSRFSGYEALFHEFDQINYTKDEFLNALKLSQKFLRKGHLPYVAEIKRRTHDWINCENSISESTTEREISQLERYKSNLMSEISKLEKELQSKGRYSIFRFLNRG